MSEVFSSIPVIKYEGPNSKNPFAYKYRVDPPANASLLAGANSKAAFIMTAYNTQFLS